MKTFLAPPPPLSTERQRLVLVAALVTAMTEIAGLLDLLPAISIGRISISASVVPAIGVLAILGRRAWGRARDHDSAQPFWIAALAGAGFGAAMLVTTGHGVDFPAVVLAALDEEVVYRFAVPTVIAAVLVVLRMPGRPARVAGFAVAAVWFVLLPGHRAQIDDLGQVLPFLAFAALSALVVYRSGSLIAAAAVHAVLNLFTILALGGELGRAGRSLAGACLLVLLVVAYGHVRPRRSPARTPGSAFVDRTSRTNGETIIDLRDGVVPTVTDVDGTRTVPAPPAGDEPDRVEAGVDRRP